MWLTPLQVASHGGVALGEKSHIPATHSVDLLQVGCVGDHVPGLHWAQAAIVVIGPFQALEHHQFVSPLGHMLGPGSMLDVRVQASDVYVISLAVW